VHGQVFLRDM